MHAVVGFGLLVLGILIFTEVLRPFRDLKIDGPIGLACVAIALTHGILILVFNWANLWIGISLTVCSSLMLIVWLGILLLLSGMKRFF